MVLYEAPHRLKKALTELAQSGFAERRLVLGRELTKKHEEFLRGTVQGLADYYQMNDPRGEYVLVLEGRRAFRQRQPQEAFPADPATFDLTDPDQILPDPEQILKTLLAEGLSVKEAAREAALRTGQKKNDLYDLALKITR